MLLPLLAPMVGLLSLGLLAAQSSQVFWLLRRLRAADFRHRGLGTVDLLPYAYALEPGIVLNKNGSLTASWLYTAPDSGGLAAADINAMAVNTNKALAKFGHGWMVQCDVVRRRAPSYTPREACHFTDPICAGIDEERRQLFERLGAMYQGYTVCTLSYLPPAGMTKHLLRWVTAEKKSDDDLAGPLAEFRAACSRLEENLRDVVTMQRLGRCTVDVDRRRPMVHDEQLRWLNHCVTGLNHPIALPDSCPGPWLTDALVGTQDFWTGKEPKIGDKHIRVVSIDGFPDSSRCSPTMLNLLTELPFEYRWNTRFIFLDAHQAEAELRKIREQWKTKTRSVRDQLLRSDQDGVDADAVAMVRSAESALEELSSGRTAHGYYTSTLVVMHDDARVADEAARAIRGAVTSTGFPARFETENSVEAFLGSLPADGRNVRRPHINTDVLADLLPLSSLWCGSPTAPCSLYPSDSPPLMHVVTHGATPFWFNLHVGDVGHTLVFGPTRTGKTVHLLLALAQARRYEGMRVFAFDSGFGMYPLTRAIHATTGGRSGCYHRLGDEEGRPSICPLQWLDTAGDREWAAQWIETILELNGLSTTAAQQNEIAQALHHLAQAPSRSMTNFSVLLQDNAIRTVLKQYTAASRGVGAMFDAPRDDLALSDFNVFEIRALMDLDARYSIPALLYAFRRIETAPPGPQAVVLDEGWVPLGNEVFAARLKKWLKTSAMANRAVVLGTQGLADATTSGFFHVLLEQAATIIYLPNAKAMEKDPAELYRRMGLNDHEIQRYIVEAEPHRHYYLTTRLGKRQYELELGPFARAFLAHTNEQDVQSVMALEKEHGNGWVDVWLKRQNLAPLRQASAA